MISSILNNISNIIKDKLTKSEYNYKLIELKQVKLADTIEIENSLLNPSAKGLLLEESKGKFKEINLESDSNYNKLETKNAQLLNPIINYNSNNDSSWFDYLKKIIFGNRNQPNLNSVFKYLKRQINLIQENNKNIRFSFNCDGKLICFINQEGNIIISNAESNDTAYILKTNFLFTEGFTSIAWDSICPNKIYFSTNNILYVGKLNEEKNEIYINKYSDLLSFSKFINCFPSPKGDLLILLYEKGMEVYDIFKNCLFSKYFTTFKFVSAVYDYKSSVFIAYTENKIIIFNLETFDFKPYTYFPGSIIKVISNPGIDNIYIFVVDKTKPLNDLFMFTLADISIASDVNFNFNSFQNYDNFYRHYHYVLRPDIISFRHQLSNYNAKVLDVCLSPNDFRIGILYEEEFRNNFKQNSLYIFGVTKDKRDNSINQISPLYNFGHIEGSQIVSFEFNKMLKEKTFLVVRFENDNFIKTETIKG